MLIDLDSRGCPQCARNLDAERAAARVVRWTLTTVVLAVVIVVILLLRRLT